MLNFSQPAIDLPPLDAPGQGDVGDLVDAALRFLLRQYLVILFLTLVGGLAGAIFLVVRPLTYTAQAKIFAGTERPQFVQQHSLLADSPFDQLHMDTQLQILISRAILAPVVQKLNLANDPEFGRRPVGLIRRVLQVWTNPTSAETKLDPTETAIAMLTDRLVVNRIGWSFLIEILASSQNPDKSAQIANAVATAYIADQKEARSKAYGTASGWLQERLVQLTEQATAADQAVVAFKQENNIVSADGRRIDEQTLADVNTRLVAARGQSSDLLVRLTRLESIIRNWDPNGNGNDAFSDEVVVGAIGQQGGQILGNLRTEYLEISRKEAEWSAKYGRNHGAVVNLRNRLYDLRTSTLEELRRVAAAIRNDYEISKERESEIEKQLNQSLSQSQTANKAQVSLRELESRAKTYHSLYESFLQRYTGGVHQDSFPLEGTRLVSLASGQSTRVKPNPLYVFMFSLMGGMGLGVGFGLLRDFMDRVFRTTTQVQSLLQIPCVTMVPLLKTSKLRGKQLPAIKLGDRTIVRDASVLWKVADSPFSIFAESIRSIKQATHYCGKGSPKVIGFTSALPNEGKSTIAAAVAQLTAKTAGRVIILDCDLRLPSLSRRLAPNARIGIGDVISGARSLEETIWKDPATGLFLLPTIRKAPPFSSEVLESEVTKSLIEKLRASFDLVIVDLPPLVPIVDVRAAAHLVDCMFLVIEWGCTKINIVRHALKTAPNLQQTIIGAVLNKTDMDDLARYDVQPKSMYESKYYSTNLGGYAGKN